MYEQEKQRATHLTILLGYTIFTIVLTGEALLLNWEAGAVLLIWLGLAASWIIHMTGKIPESSRMWLYFILTMLAFFFYGSHAVSFYDSALVMIVLIIVYSATEIDIIVTLCAVTYYLTVCYDLVFVFGSSLELTSLVIARIASQLLLVCIAERLVRLAMQRRRSERKNMDERIARLEETNRRTEDFLTNVSHELRTPINAVTGLTAVMLQHEKDAVKKKDILSVQMAGHRLFNQIEDILDYTEIDTGKMKISEDTYMISSVINDIITGNRVLEMENAPELIFDIDTRMPSVFIGDARKIKKIIKHIIDNAVKFTKKGGVYIRVSTLKKDYGVNLCIRVSDTGIGIDEESLGKIRERFYQSNGGRNRRAGGLGLGLPIVYGMVAAMEGFIQIESTEGSGTTVAVSIPQKVADDTPGMAVENREGLCLGCFLRPEKYEVPEVRNYYDEMISHMSSGLELPLHRASNMDGLERMLALYRLTHLFIGKEEYEENAAYFEGMDKNTEVIVVAEDNFVLPKNSRVKLIRKPFYSLPVVNLLNAGTARAEEHTLENKRMICPGIRTLIVDDEPMNLMVAEGIFKAYRMKVKMALSGREAIELCEKEDFDLIFMDHMMPEMDGIETLKRLRKMTTDTDRSFTIIAFTANAVSGAREMFLQEGFDEFVSKPIEYPELERVLRKLLPKNSITYMDDTYETNEMPKQQESEEEAVSGEQEADEMTRLEAGGINTQSGLSYCQNDKDFYLELLAGFAQDAPRKEKGLNDFLKQGDWDNYRIIVHALKSAAKTVGAGVLSEMARHAEDAAKNHDADYIEAHQEALLAKYRDVVQCINSVTASEENGAKEEVSESCGELSKDGLLQRLAELKGSLDTFEADKAEALLAEMKDHIYHGTSVGGLLEEIRQDVENFEFGAAMTKLEECMHSVEGGET